MSNICNVKEKPFLTFKDFLIENNVWELYQANLTFDCIETKATKKNWINFAFKWRETPQGYNFWSDLNKKWLEALRVSKEVYYD